MEKLILIDGNSLLNRAFYATPVFTTSSGQPTNAIFGFVKLVFKILGDMKPEYIVVAFDLKSPTFRHKMYNGYKATRKGMPEDLAAQVEPLKSLLSAMNIYMCSKAGYEADDIIGTLSKKFDVHSYIYTGDRDSFQLVDEKTDVFYTKRGVSELLRLNIDNFKEETGLTPSQIVDLKSLMGDTSDNIPGVRGIGEKTAFGLLEKYGTLDGVYENIDEIKGATKTKLSENKDTAYLSYKLATIDRNCELEVDLNDCHAPSKYSDEVKKMFSAFEFKSLLGLNIFETPVEETESIKYPQTVRCETVKELSAVLSANDFGVLLTEDGMEIYDGEKQYSYELPYDLFGLLVDGEYKKFLNKIFGDKKNRIVTFDCKAVMHRLAEYGIEFKCAFDDISLLIYLADYNSGYADGTFKQLCEGFEYDYKYSAYLATVFYKKYFAMLDGDTLKLYDEIEKPVVKVLFEMEREGVTVSRDTLEELSFAYERKIEEYREKIYEMCGCTFNVNSPAQLGEVLFTRLGITQVKNKKTGKFSTNADLLEKLSVDYPVLNFVLKYRTYQKLHSTYIESYKPLLRRETGVIHTTYNQTATVTGRLSSANPNLQNIPIRESEGRELRKMFVPKEGNVFIDADYSQIELRLLAHFSDCKELIDAYKNGDDIHALTASQVFGVSLEEVTDNMRRAAKAVNFGIIYGISDFGLAKNLNIPVSTAHAYIERYFESYSMVREYMRKNVEFAKANGYVSTLTGRKRRIPEINSSNYNMRQFGERAAMNMPLQGSSADIIKIAMIKVRDALKKANLKAKLILQVHDELVLDAPIEEAERASEILKYEMENAVSLKVPLTVDVHSGKNWYDAK